MPFVPSSFLLLLAWHLLLLAWHLFLVAFNLMGPKLGEATCAAHEVGDFGVAAHHTTAEVAPCIAGNPKPPGARLQIGRSFFSRLVALNF